jgi:hypothetical protein
MLCIDVNTSGFQVEVIALLPALMLHLSHIDFSRIEIGRLNYLLHYEPGSEVLGLCSWNENFRLQIQDASET